MTTQKLTWKQLKKQIITDLDNSKSQKQFIENLRFYFRVKWYLIEKNNDNQ